MRGPHTHTKYVVGILPYILYSLVVNLVIVEDLYSADIMYEKRRKSSSKFKAIYLGNTEKTISLVLALHQIFQRKNISTHLQLFFFMLKYLTYCFYYFFKLIKLHIALIYFP